MTNRIPDDCGSNVKRGDVRKKASILRRSVTEPKLSFTHSYVNSQTMDDEPDTLFSRRFMMPYDPGKDTECESQGPRCASSKTSLTGRLLHRHSVQSSVGITTAPLSAACFQSRSTSSLGSKDRPITTHNKSSRARLNRISPRLSIDSHPQSQIETTLPTVEKGQHCVSETWACSRQNATQCQQIKQLESDSFVSTDSRLSMVSVSPRQNYRNVDVQTVLDYTTQQMDLFAAKHFNGSEPMAFKRQGMYPAPPSREYSLVMGQLIEEIDINNNHETKNPTKRRSRKQWNKVKQRFRVTNNFLRRKSSRDVVSTLKNPTTQTPVEDMTTTDNEKAKKSVEPPTKCTGPPSSRGWLLVRANIKRIVDMAPTHGIDSKPKLNIRHFVELVKAKEFRLLMKRRASFVENGKFHYEEAKADLYARYSLPAADDQISNASEGSSHRIKLE